jgi:uncharacterized protein (TIGR03435 family)
MTGLALLLTTAAFGQTFEVASVKPCAPAAFAELIRSGKLHEDIDSARADIGAFSLKDLISFAYRVDQDRISGPNWIAELRFDVMAKLPAGSNKKQAPEMMQALLAERFKLVLRHQERVMPVYALVVGKSGPKFKEAAADSKDQTGCIGGRGGHRVCHKMTMEALAGMLTALSNPVAQGWSGIDRPVVDLTGLKGEYDFTMDIGATGGRRGGVPGDTPPGENPPVISAVDAVQQLGLKLEPQKHPFDYITVDHAEKVPTEN